MLKNLLKYEFRATARTYGGIYLALLAAAGLIGFSLRGDRAAAQSHGRSWARRPDGIRGPFA